MGRSSGAAIGTVNGCRALVMHYRCQRAPVHSTELAIVPVYDHDSGGHASSSFAREGDSGALVFGARHRQPNSTVWGYATEDTRKGLLPLTQSRGITFATPLEPVLKDIKAHLEAKNPGQTVEVALL